MTRHLKILSRAREDAQHIFDYIRERSPKGATDWWLAFEDAAAKAAEEHVQYGRGPEDHLVGYELRQVLFKTRRGRTIDNSARTSLATVGGAPLGGRPCRGV
jgi:plasmid stabilization system protein ParE